MQRAHFRVRGVPVRVDPSFALVALFGIGIGSLSLGLAWVAIVFVTTLVHELGHAFAFRRYGRPSSITLWGFGGLTQGEGPALDRGKSIVVSLAGPFAGMIFMGLPALLVRNALHAPTPTVADALNILVWVSITWSAVNLLPVIPLDGGHVADNVLQGLWGTPGAYAARILSIVVAGAAGGYALSRGYTFASLFAMFFIAQNAREIATMREAKTAGLLQHGHAALDAGDIGSALRVAGEILQGSRNPGMKAAAAELAAWAHLAAGRRAEAARVLEQLPHERRPSRGLLAAFLLADGQNAAAAETAAEALTQESLPNEQLARALDRAGLAAEVADRVRRTQA